MKTRKSSAKKSQCRILGDQAEKLKDKLQNLKEQIKLKKQQKKMNETATSIGSFHKDYKNQRKQQRLNSTQYTRKQENELLGLLRELKIQNIASKLQQKSVSKINHLLKVNDEQIDKWKDIPIGYRIKLKIYIQKSKAQISLSKLTQCDNQSKKDKPPMKDIQQIIKNRKAEQVYIPIERKIQEVQQKQYIRQLQQTQQQEMMKSILQVLGGKYRKSILKKERTIKQKKKVNWSQSVDQMQKIHKEQTYPKEKVNKQIFHQRPNTAQPITKNQQNFQKNKQIYQNKITSSQNQLPNYNYCWSCLKKLNQSNILQKQRYFCSHRCAQTYNKQASPTYFFDKISQVEDKYNQFKSKSLDAQFTEENEISFDIM